MSEDQPAPTPTYFKVPVAPVISSVFKKTFDGLDAYQRHQKLVNDYLLHYGGDQKRTDDDERRKAAWKTELDVLKEHHRFVRDEEDNEISWEARVAKKYYDKLFKEYALCNLSRYKEGRVALRWRTANEVVIGKGQFTCGNLLCSETEQLHSWEVNFAYMEQGVKKNTLVKVRLCMACSYKLNYKKIKERAKEERKRKRKDWKHDRKRRKRHSDDEDSRSDGGKERLGSVEIKIKRRDDTKSTDGGGSDEEEAEQQREAVELLKATQSSRQYSREEASRIWSAPAQVEEQQDKTRDEEFEEYFAELFQ
ncbi:hypothetical protein HK102_014099 [Quaeritorhiza haematococci]|nr:hypothetical protein HK102_014099 [Quaeritorhiza haematococci]